MQLTQRPWTSAGEGIHLIFRLRQCPLKSQLLVLNRHPRLFEDGRKERDAEKRSMRTPEKKGNRKRREGKKKERPADDFQVDYLPQATDVRW